METRMSSVELLLDEGAEAQVRAEWTALADAGLSSLARHDAASNRPHLTLLARVGLPKPPLEHVELPLPLLLGPPMLLGSGDRRVLARVVLPSPALLALQATIREAAGPADDGHFLAGGWLPHVTLARRLRLVDTPTALELLGEPIDASAVAIRHWDPATATLTTLASS